MTQRALYRKKLRHQLLIFGVSLALVLLLSCVLLSTRAYAAPGVTIDFNPDDTGNGSMGVLDIIILFVVLSLIPSILLMMTSFTRLIIVLSMMRSALGTQQSPPNQLLVGLALFLTFFIMAPTFEQIKTDAYEPYREGTYTAMEAVEVAQTPIKKFMLGQTTPKSLRLYLSISGSEIPQVESLEDIDKLTELSLFVIVPAFVTSELERAFLIGFLLYLPFLIIDIVVSSVLMSMGMVMLPPATISLPFKILMFILVDGWNLLLGTLVQGFL